MTGKQGTIGIITNITTGVFQRHVIQGISEIAAQRGYDVVIEALEESSTESAPVDLAERAVDGVLVIANAAPEDTIRHLYQTYMPVSLISHEVPDIPVPAVLSNNRQGVAALVEHIVIKCERHQPVFIRGINQQADATQREDALHQELMRYNLRLPEAYLLQGDFAAEVAAQSMQTFLQIGAPFDAVIAADYIMAGAAVEVLRSAGVQVPQQVSVVGFGDGPEAEAAGLTIVAADVIELGRRAAYQLIGQIKGLRIRGATTLSVHMIIRETCGYCQQD
ncbi:LacI family DNA-binding transcriptional regulator [Chloroflexota bacterium]